MKEFNVDYTDFYFSSRKNFLILFLVKVNWNYKQVRNRDVIIPPMPERSLGKSFNFSSSGRCLMQIEIVTNLHILLFHTKIDFWKEKLRLIKTSSIISWLFTKLLNSFCVLRISTFVMLHQFMRRSEKRVKKFTLCFVCMKPQSFFWLVKGKINFYVSVNFLMITSLWNFLSIFK